MSLTPLLRRSQATRYLRPVSSMPITYRTRVWACDTLHHISRQSSPASHDKCLICFSLRSLRFTPLAVSAFACRSRSNASWNRSRVAAQTRRARDPAPTVARTVACATNNPAVCRVWPRSTTVVGAFIVAQPQMNEHGPPSCTRPRPPARVERENARRSGVTGVRATPRHARRRRARHRAAASAAGGLDRHALRSRRYPRGPASSPRRIEPHPRQKFERFDRLCTASRLETGRRDRRRRRRILA